MKQWWGGRKEHILSISLYALCHILLVYNKSKPNTHPPNCFHHSAPLLRGNIAVKISKVTPPLFLDDTTSKLRIDLLDFEMK